MFAQNIVEKNHKQDHLVFFPDTIIIISKQAYIINCLSQKKIEFLK